MKCKSHVHEICYGDPSGSNTGPITKWVQEWVVIIVTIQNNIIKDLMCVNTGYPVLEKLWSNDRKHFNIYIYLYLVAMEVTHLTFWKRDSSCINIGGCHDTICLAYLLISPWGTLMSLLIWLSVHIDTIEILLNDHYERLPWDPKQEEMVAKTTSGLHASINYTFQCSLF